MKKAFTLIELLLVISLLAVITVVGFLGFNTAVSSWRTGTAIADSMQHADYIFEQIEMGLRSACYPDNPQPDGAFGMQLTDDGEGENARDVLTWSKLDKSLVGKDSQVANVAHRVTMYVIDPDSSDDESLREGGLVIKAWPMYCLPEDFDPENEEFVKPNLIMPGVVGMDIYVRDPKNNFEQGKFPGLKEESSAIEDDELKWITGEDWTGDHTNRLPHSVKIALYFAPVSEQDDKTHEVQRAIEIPCAPLSWRDKGNDMAGGSKQTGGNKNGRDNNRANRNNNGRGNMNNGNRNNGNSQDRNRNNGGKKL